MFGAGLDAGVLWKIRLPRTAAVGGMIARVGMIVPHIARLIMEPDYRKLLPASLLIGAIFLLVVDDFARTLFAIELLLGMLTVLVGALMFWGRSCEQGENERDVYDYEGDECAGMEA
jgi:ABC-type cobalamin transport system permease subunit